MTQFKKDHTFAAIGLVLWLTCPFMLLAAVWFDGRWGWTSGIVFLFGCLLFIISAALDDHYKKKGIRE